MLLLLIASTLPYITRTTMVSKSMGRYRLSGAIDGTTMFLNETPLQHGTDILHLVRDWQFTIPTINDWNFVCYFV